MQNYFMKYEIYYTLMVTIQTSICKFSLRVCVCVCVRLRARARSP